jgi:hypothetical protein
LNNKGCYEGIVFGSMENTVKDMTQAAHIGVIKCDRIPPEGILFAEYKLQINMH